MSETMERTLWYKVRYTPIRDFLRGRMTARLDFNRPLEVAPLPPSVRELVYQVVKHTRLWRLEKAEVMSELVAHFADGIASGASSEQLIKAFGDPEQSAKLIRRGMRRNRPLPWQALRAIGWSTMALLIFYFGFAIYFFLGRPSPQIDYVANLNQAIEDTPVQDRAWPVYRRALLALGPVWRQSAPSFKTSGYVRPGSREGALLVESLARFKTELDLIREGAAKPRLGFVFGLNGSAYDHELWPDREPGAVEGTAGQDLARVEIPHLFPMAKMSTLLGADAVMAREERDSQRLLRNIDSMLGLARQIREGGFLLAGLISLAIYDAALDQIDQTLSEAPALLSDSDWVALAHRLSGPKVAGDLITTDFERMNFADLLQRSFTDDGEGNGRLTREGVDHVIGLTHLKSHWIQAALEPVAGLVVASRQDLAREYARYTDRAYANLLLPLREADWQTARNDPAQRRLSPLDSLNYRLIQVVTPSYQHPQTIAERYLGQRDGILVGVVVELYRRQHGRYPESLAQLVSALLPEVPADRISGEPVRYRLVDGQPVVYSVGADRKDDRGRPAVNRMGIASPETAAQWEAFSGPVPDGDWVLYPRNRQPSR